MSRRKPPGPGITRVRDAVPVYEQSARGMRSVESIWRALLSQADVISEGRVEDDGIYRGSTNLLLKVSPRGPIPRPRLSVLVRAATVDPHFRVHVVRLARREAYWRSGGQLDTAQLEVSVWGDERGLHVNVDISAEVLSSRQAAEQ